MLTCKYCNTGIAAMSIAIKTLSPEQRHGWERLFRGYTAFYQVEITDAAIQQVWEWMIDSTHPNHCLLAVDDHNHPVGLAHYRTVASNLRGCYTCFLDDLFVAPQARGARIGAMLIEHLTRMASTHGWPLIRWTTDERNYRARNLYDRLADVTSWKTYELQIPSAGTI